MLREQLIILYVGADAQMAEWLVDGLEPYEGYVHKPTELLEALGMYITYMPDLVVLDARSAPELAREVYFHLRTVDAEPILILDDGQANWDYPPQSSIRVQTPVSNADLGSEIGDLLGTEFAIGEGA